MTALRCLKTERFIRAVNPEWFQELNIITMQINSRVVKLYVKGDEARIRTYLESLKPLVLELLPVQLEEMFIQEVIHNKEAVHHEL